MASNWDPKPEIWEYIHLLWCGTCLRNLLFHIDHTGNLSQESLGFKPWPVSNVLYVTAQPLLAQEQVTVEVRGEFTAHQLSRGDCVEAFWVFAGSAIHPTVTGCFHRRAVWPLPQGPPQQLGRASRPPPIPYLEQVLPPWQCTSSTGQHLPTLLRH